MNIAIRGTGKFGQYIYNEIKNNTKYSIRYFIDNNSTSWGKEIDKIPVVSPEYMDNELADEVDYVLIAFANSTENYKKIITRECFKYGFVRNRVLDASLHLKEDLRLDRNIIWNDAEYMNKPVLRSLETNVVDYCNLNCRGCSHFSNLFSCDDSGIPFNIFCKDLKQISENVYINNLYLLGGEVLLNDRICEYIKYARTILPYSDIQLVTNGLLLPKQKPEFYECCVENDVMISISGYKPTLMIKREIMDILQKYHVLYAFREEVKDFGKNIDLLGKAEIHEACGRCRESKCHFLRNGKIYKCPFQALGNVFFEHYNIGLRFNCGIDIYQKEMDWEKTVDILHNEPVDECRYCGKEERTEWKVENNPSISDWVISGGGC